MQADSALVTKIVPSPNLGPRKTDRRPVWIMLHYTGMESGVAALQLLTNPLSEVSCHYLVWEDGRIFQLVPEVARAWHAGRGSWKGEEDLNSHSIGIEIVNGGHRFGLPPYPPAQIEAVIALCQDIMARHTMPAGHVLAHSDSAPTRKEDPGEHFPWQHLAQAGVGLWPQIEPVPASASALYQLGDEGQPVRALQALLAMIGYPVQITGVYDALTESVIKTVQRRYRPQSITGMADGATLSVLKALARPTT
jgi:N-acetylmuramoyl-L-alanine amidase